MADFVKVNFKNGDTAILSKNTFCIRHEAECDSYLIYSSAIIMHSIPQILRNYTDNMLKVVEAIVGKYGLKPAIDRCVNDATSFLYDYWDSVEITREEYDRLCKELGVE